MVVIAFVASVCSMLCFSFQRGYNSMKAFLRYYVVRHPDMVQRRASSSLDIPDIPEAAKTPDTPEASKIPGISETLEVPENPEASKV